MTDRTESFDVADSFAEPAATARYLIQETGQQMSYAELAKDIAEDLRPRNSQEYKQLLETMGALELG